MSIPSEAKVIMWRESCFLRRSPVPIVLGFVNPVLWLVLFGSIFYNLGRFPGFPAPNYITYLVPGILAMNAVARGMISSFNLVWHRYYGFLDKVLVTPISRSSIFWGQMGVTVLFGVAESLLIMGIGWLMGMHMAGGLIGVHLIVIVYVSVELIFIGFSMTMIRSVPEQYIGMLQLLMLPPIFLSSALFPLGFAPAIIRNVSRLNPVTHAVDAMRLVMVQGVDWNQFLFNWGIVIAVAIVFLFLGHRALVKGLSKHNS
jgi:ABC-2 type transport system permease protein